MGDSDSSSPNWFETVLDSISAGVFTVDNDFRITFFNRAAEYTTGVSRADAIGQPCCNVLRSTVCKDACALLNTKRTGVPVVNQALHISNSHGELIPVTITTAVLHDEHGKVIGGVETFRDLNRVRKQIHEAELHYDDKGFKTQDPKLRGILEVIPTIAQSDSTVLIEGPSGTGKGLLARAVHAHSTRSKKPLVTLNCGALPENLLESELFGYRKGAFTGAVKDKPGRIDTAEGGTLFLDEIGDMPLSIQVKMLRVLQEITYEPLGDVRSVTADVRIITATNRNLEEMVHDKQFREDLYYRIRVIRLEMPPLKDRMGDVPILAEHILHRLSATRGKQVLGITREALDILMSHHFPGNVRELENILEHAFVMTQDPQIGLEDLPEELVIKARIVSPTKPSDMRSFEMQMVREALERSGWNCTKTARELGIHRTTLYRKMRKLGIQSPASTLDDKSKETA